MAHSKENAAKPRKIAIVGAGIAGLTTAIALVRTAGIPGEDIDIYEPRAGVDYGHGAAVNLNGGNFILSKFYNISLTQMGNPIQRVVGQDVNGRTLFDVDVLAAFRDFGTEDLIDADGNVLAHFVMRDDLQAVLTQRVVDEGVVIHRGKSNAVRNVLVSDGVARLELAEASTTREYDLVIGADGVRSTIRKMVAGPEAQATYTGFRMQWGICPRGVHTESALPHGQSYQIFGDGGYALHYAAGAKDNSCQMFALAQRSDRPVDENVEYRSEEALRERIAESLKSSAMPSEVWDTFERSDRFIETGIYSHPLTKQWSRDGVCVLVGDSAHAMAPFLGQGANQCIQDAHTLAVAISGVGTKHATLKDALQAYEKIRRAPTQAIVKSSGLIGWIETQRGILGTTVRDALFSCLGYVRGVDRIFAKACIPRIG